MNLGITGASGLIGTALIDHALRRGHEVIAFTRHPERAIPGCTMRAFSTAAPPDLSDCEAIVHLAGESVMGLWTEEKKRRILESRVEGTRRIVEAINAARTKPEVFIGGSAIGIYGDSGESEITEQSPAGSGFLAETVRAWEDEALKADGVRTILLRTSIVLSRHGGMLKVLTPIFKAALGGPIASGQQWMPWIHIDDEARLVLFAIENLDIAGPLNATAPWPIRNEEFARELARTLRRPAVFRVPGFAVKMLGEFSHELLDSKRVLPAVALDHGFGFQHSELPPALKNLLG